MIYNNPNEAWMQPDPLKGMNDDERLGAGCLQMLIYFAVVALALVVCSMFSSCKTTEFVNLPEVHTEHHWHTDSVSHTDSIIERSTVIVREADSATMAAYGITLAGIQRAWLVESSQLRREIERLRETKTDTVTVRDSIPYPVEVIKEVPAPMPWWKKTLFWLGIFFVFTAFILLITKVKVKRLNLP